MYFPSFNMGKIFQIIENFRGGQLLYISSYNSVPNLKIKASKCRGKIGDVEEDISILFNA
jgi:hypothetical protein